MRPKSLPTYNLLSIGHRGVGKSVFLVGSYAERLQDQQPSQVSTWFEGADEQSRRMLDSLLSYMRMRGLYPAPTMKITDFTFEVRSRIANQEQAVCQFRWADIPGEICRLDNPDFEAMLLASHGCCVFIDAAALVHDVNYLTQLEDTIKQIEVISSLATQCSVNYFFALILTKCDQLNADPDRIAEIEQKWKLLTAQLKTANAVYRRFHTSVSVIPTEGPAVVRGKGTSAPFLWLVSELSRVYQTQAPRGLQWKGEDVQIDRSERPNIAPKAISMLAALGVAVGLWFGIDTLLTNQAARQIPVVEQENTEAIGGGEL